MPLIPSKLSFLPTFDGRESLYSSIIPESETGPYEIRILTIWPNHERSASIEGSLSVQPFSGGVPYNAISYYWGDLNELEKVIIYGSDQGASDLICKVPVSKNLTAALRQFRAEASAKGDPLQLWTDALCINQADAKERALQVSGMRFIFGNAESVWVWLGESDDLVERGLAAFIDQANSYKTRLRKGAAPSLDHSTSLAYSLNEDVCVVKQLAAISALPYWRRGWVFQEPARSMKYVCYGKLRIILRSWLELLLTCLGHSTRIHNLGRDDIAFRDSFLSLLSPSEAEFLNSNCSDYFLIPFVFAEKMLEMWFDDYIRGLAYTDKLSRNKITESSVFHSRGFLQDIYLLNIFYRTSDPRDSVLALCEVIPAFASIELDYTDTIEGIFGKATEALLRNPRDHYGKLQHWVHPHASSQLPSWVLDFTHCNHNIDANGHERFLRREICSDASASSSTRIVHCDDISIHVAGFTFDNIHDISKCPERPERAYYGIYALGSWLSLAQVHLLPFKPSRQEGATYARALVRTFATASESEHDFTLAALRLPKSVHWDNGPVEVLEAMSECARLVQEVENSDGFARVSRLMRDINTNLRRAKFFVTGNHRMGLAPMDAAVGDRIAIFASGEVPFVLRPVPMEYAGEEAYRIIGGCYLDGMSHSRSGVW